MKLTFVALVSLVLGLLPVSTTSCTKQQGAIVQQDLQSLEYCAVNALGEGFVSGFTDPLVIAGQCAGLAVADLAKVVVDLLNNQPNTADGGVSVALTPRVQYLLQVQQNLQKLGYKASTTRQFTNTNLVNVDNVGHHIVVPANDNNRSSHSPIF